MKLVFKKTEKIVRKKEYYVLNKHFLIFYTVLKSHFPAGHESMKMHGTEFASDTLTKNTLVSAPSPSKNSLSKASFISMVLTSKRKREGEKDRERKTDRQRERETDRQTDRQKKGREKKGRERAWRAKSNLTYIHADLT